jgi:small subunit ribosomal protein S7
MSDIKLFNRWDTTGIKVEDPGLKRYINLNPVLVPRTGGRNVKIQFWKSKNPIVERLITKLMVPGHRGKKHKYTSGHCTGKWINAAETVEKCFELIEKQTKQNPVAVFIKAVENSAPREEITTIEYGGARYPQAVDTAPQRRIDISMRMMVQGAYAKSFNNKRKIFQTLADEIIKSYQNDATSSAIAKKNEFERQADSSR